MKIKDEVWLKLKVFLLSLISAFLLLFGLAPLHEFGHALICLGFGGTIESIQFYPFVRRINPYVVCAFPSDYFLLIEKELRVVNLFWDGWSILLYIMLVLICLYLFSQSIG